MNMNRILHTIILYIATTVISACILNLLLCNITYYLISRTATAMLIAQIIGWTAAIVLEVLFVRCRPLTEEEKTKIGIFPKIQFGKGRQDF